MEAICLGLEELNIFEYEITAQTGLTTSSHEISRGFDS